MVGRPRKHGAPQPLERLAGYRIVPLIEAASGERVLVESGAASQDGVARDGEGIAGREANPQRHRS